MDCNVRVINDAVVPRAKVRVNVCGECSLNRVSKCRVISRALVVLVLNRKAISSFNALTFHHLTIQHSWSVVSIPDM